MGPQLKLYVGRTSGVSDMIIIDDPPPPAPRKWRIRISHARCLPPCRIRSDRQTSSLTLTTGVCEAGTKMRGASNMNIHYDVTGLLTAAWRSHSGQIVWAA